MTEIYILLTKHSHCSTTLLFVNNNQTKSWMFPSSRSFLYFQNPFQLNFFQLSCHFIARPQSFHLVAGCCLTTVHGLAVLQPTACSPAGLCYHPWVCFSLYLFFFSLSLCSCVNVLWTAGVHGWLNVCECVLLDPWSWSLLHKRFQYKRPDSCSYSGLWLNHCSRLPENRHHICCFFNKPLKAVIVVTAVSWKLRIVSLSFPPRPGFLTSVCKSAKVNH